MDMSILFNFKKKKSLECKRALYVHVASGIGHNKTVHRLITCNKGADFDLQTKTGDSALSTTQHVIYVACKYGHESVVKCMLTIALCDEVDCFLV